ncbi:MAG TPA: hypothetical protein VFO65_06365, partial [Acidimicrobiales bacterium]|nr:hypothetical protein [Acidimicrobiales bacterium]
MSYQLIAGVVVVVWVLTGVVLGVVMTRRGYSGYGWGVIGTVLGPLAVVVALFARGTARADLVTSAGVPGAGPTHVLAGVDGSPASLDAALSAADLLDDRIGRFTLAIVAPV